MMRNTVLATASLLAKKLAIPGTALTIDFRVGPTGNIANDMSEARNSAAFFLEVAAILGIRANVAITDNRSFPSSALGRLESLDLLCAFFTGREIANALDREHREVCIRIAGAARDLAIGARADSSSEEVIRTSIVNGTAWRTFLEHLSAQGGSEEALTNASVARTCQITIPVRAQASGLWEPPNLAFMKEWIKSAQSRVECILRHHDAHAQVGIRLLATPGAPVSVGDAVFEVRIPVEIDLAMIGEIPAWGSVDSIPKEPFSPLFALVNGND